MLAQLKKLLWGNLNFKGKIIKILFNQPLQAIKKHVCDHLLAYHYRLSKLYFQILLYQFQRSCFHWILLVWSYWFFSLLLVPKLICGVLHLLLPTNVVFILFWKWLWWLGLLTHTVWCNFHQRIYKSIFLLVYFLFEFVLHLLLQLLLLIR